MQLKQKSFLANIEHVLALFNFLTNLPLTTFQPTYQTPTTNQPMIKQLQLQPDHPYAETIKNFEDQQFFDIWKMNK